MADFNTVLVAKRAMKISVESIFADASLSEAGRIDVLRKNASDYAEHLRLPLIDAEEAVAKVMTDAGAPSAIIMKITPKEQHRQAAERAAAAGRKLRRQNDPNAPKQDEPSINPDPALVGEEDKKMRHATNAEMLKLVQRAVAEEVRKIRADNPRLNESQARSRLYVENPGVRQSLVKLARGPENELAKRSSSAEIEVTAKTAEIKNANPELTDAQAYTRAIEATPGLMKRLLGERSGSSR